jgi:hypothetical protein
VVGGLANMRWLLQGRRAVATRRRALLPPASVTAVGEPYPPEPDDIRVALAGGTRHHRPGCAAVAGKPVKRMSTARHERAGRRTCGLCDR